MKILVAIANHGTKNQPYLDRLLREYRSMSYEVRIVVLSDIEKNLGPDVEVRVGAPTPNPRSLPFGHRKLFTQERENYDLFIYTEDDVLLTQKNIEAFLGATEVLHEDEIAGFFRTEEGPDGRMYCVEAHAMYHWVPGSVRTRGAYKFAILSNDHAACFILTKAQLKKAIQSGGFDVAPHEDRYNMLETAACDPYLHCGFTKLLCVSHVDDFIIPHLPNRYLDSSMEYHEWRLQIPVLLATDQNGEAKAELMPTETRLPKTRFSKNYYEPIRKPFTESIPRACNVLSIGCGSGLTEKYLIEAGCRVCAIPLDLMIGAVAKTKGINVTKPGLDEALAEMGDQKFDFILCDWVLHLWPDTSALLEWISHRLADNGVLLAVVPNLNHYSPLWSRLRGRPGYRDLGSYERTGIHKTTRGQLRAWLRKAGLKVDRMTTIMPDRHRRMARFTGPLGTELLATEIVVAARPTATNGAALQP